jgi:OmpA-OmpF porin, OOP family
MYRRVTSVIAGALVSIGLTSCLLISPAQAQTASDQGAAAHITNGQKIETKGLILTRDGENMQVETRDMGNILVELHPETKVQVPKGIFRHSDMETTSLIPGLDVEIKGTGTETGHVVADSVRFTKDSLRIAQQAHAAMTATKAQSEANRQGVEENQRGISSNKGNIEANASNISQHTQEINAVQKRFSDLTEYDVKKDIFVNFETGKSDLSAEAKQELAQLAKEAQGMKGYLVEVKGFASTSGGTELNQQLSEDRAESVVTYLQQQGITIQHIINPGAMGTTNPVAVNATEEGRQRNQRVEVKVLVNRGVGGAK